MEVSKLTIRHLFSSKEVNLGLGGNKEMTMKCFAGKTDRFIRIEPVYNTRKFLIQCNKLKLVLDKTPLGWNKFFKKLFSYERNNSYNYKAYKTRYCITLKVLIPHELNEEKYADFIQEFVNEILKDNKELPYVAFYMKEGKGKYLYVAISEREYFTKKKKIEITARRTIFKDSITGKICTQDNPNAALFRTKGEIISEETTNFGLKVKLFHFVNHSTFKHFMDYTKRLCVSILETYNMEKEEQVILSKYNYSKLDTFKEKRNAKRLNKEIKKVEKQLDDFYNGLYLTKQINEINTKKIFMSIYSKYQQLINNLKFTYNNKSYEINLHSSRIFFESILELLRRKLNDDLSTIAQVIY